MKCNPTWFRNNYWINTENGWKRLQHVFSGIIQWHVFTQWKPSIYFTLEIIVYGNKSSYTLRFDVHGRLVEMECINQTYKNGFHMWICAIDLTVVKRWLGITLFYNCQLSLKYGHKMSWNTQPSWICITTYSCVLCKPNVSILWDYMYL